MADRRACRLCLHEYVGTDERAHIDLFVRRAWRISKLDTFEISADFAAELAAYLESGQGDVSGGQSRPAICLRILSEPVAGAESPGAQAGAGRPWRAERKADHRLKYWRHTGPIEGLDALGRDRGHLRELARGILLGPWPVAGVGPRDSRMSSGTTDADSGFWFTLEPRNEA